MPRSPNSRGFSCESQMKIDVAGIKVSSCFSPRHYKTSCDLYFTLHWYIDVAVFVTWIYWQPFSLVLHGGTPCFYSDVVTVAISTVATFPLFKIPEGLSALEMSSAAPSKTLEKSRPSRALSLSLSLSCWSVQGLQADRRRCNRLQDWTSMATGSGARAPKGFTLCNKQRQQSLVKPICWNFI